MSQGNGFKARIHGARNLKREKTIRETSMKKYQCVVCDYIYDPTVGDEEASIPAGTPFEELPDDWVCPLCGVGKSDFVPI